MTSYSQISTYEYIDMFINSNQNNIFHLKIRHKMKIEGIEIGSKRR